MLPVNTSMIINLEILIRYALTHQTPQFGEIITKQGLVGLKLKILMVHIMEETKRAIITMGTTTLVIITILVLVGLVMVQVGQEPAIKN